MEVKDLLERIPLQEGPYYLFAALTDEYLIDSASPESFKMLEEKAGKLLDLRVFSSSEEYHLVRCDIGKAFAYRKIRDAEGQENGTVTEEDGTSYSLEYYAEDQYLDIDTRKSADDFLQDRTVISTGGGKYRLPAGDMQDAGVRIHYYLDRYPLTGQARVRDWRIAGLLGGK